MLLEPTVDGLWCEAGGFHVDPWRPVPLAVVTHAHADHATPGCGRYLASERTLDVMRVRFSKNLEGTPVDWGTPIDLGRCRVSLHPAGHVLGSAQIRIECDDDVLCVTGDYKREADPTAEPFELVPCDTAPTESTFGLPIYRWPEPSTVFDKMNAWWRENAAAGRTTVFLSYAFGKAQRILAGLDASIGPIGVHGSLVGPNSVYTRAGIRLPDVLRADADSAATLAGGGAIVCPPSATGTPWIRRFNGPEGARMGFVSGWMQVRGRRRWRAVDRGFILSDHADWDGLISTVRTSGARRVGVTHGSSDVLARYLQEKLELETFVVPTRYVGESPPTSASPTDASEDEGVLGSREDSGEAPGDGA